MQGLNIDNLSHRIGTKEILKTIQLQISCSQKVALLGPNGAGKSTLLRLLSGILRMQTGFLRFNDKDISENGYVSPIFRRHMGVVFQEPSLDKRLSAYQNLALNGRLYGLRGVDLYERIEQTLIFCGLQDRKNEAVENFSGGMKRKLELGRALLHRPLILLMDEPTTGLDEAHFRQFWDLLQNQSKVLLLVATHKSEEAELCDRVLIMHDGCIVADENPNALKQRVVGDVLSLGFAPNLNSARKDEILLKLQKIFQQDQLHDKNNSLELSTGSAHEKVPWIFQHASSSEIAYVQVRRPTLADGYLSVLQTHELTRK